jgi:hypothetical protein
MKSKPSVMPLVGLLFVFNIENACDEEREEVIVSKDINVDVELCELFDVLLRPEFLRYSPSAQEKYIALIAYYMEAGDNFDDLFKDMDMYFDQEVQDQRHFMKILLSCLKRYQSEVISEL